MKVFAYSTSTASIYSMSEPTPVSSTAVTTSVFSPALSSPARSGMLRLLQVMPSQYTSPICSPFSVTRT